MNFEKNTTQFATISDTAKITGLSRFYIRERIKSGTIPFIQCGNKYLINVSRFLELLDNESVGGK